MKKYVCTVCGYVYDPAAVAPAGGVKPGTSFDDLADTWVCPFMPQSSLLRTRSIF